VVRRYDPRPSERRRHLGWFRGVDKLNAEIQGRKTPEGVAESEMKAQFLENARAQITGTAEGLHIKDPKGDELYLKFLADVLPRNDAARREGKSAASLFNPESPDYLGKAIAASSQRGRHHTPHRRLVAGTTNGLCSAVAT
jgi:hypothetical protein